MEPVPLSGGDDSVERARELVKLIAAEIDDNMIEALDELRGILWGLRVHKWAKTWIDIRYAILGMKRFRKAGRGLTKHMKTEQEQGFPPGHCPHCGRRHQ